MLVLGTKDELHPHVLKCTQRQKKGLIDTNRELKFELRKAIGSLQTYRNQLDKR